MMRALAPKSLSVVLILAAIAPALAEGPKSDPRRLFARENLIAWCIVPFDSKHRGPEERAAMLERLGFRHFAYDWRGEHAALLADGAGDPKRHGDGRSALMDPEEV